MNYFGTFRMPRALCSLALRDGSGDLENLDNGTGQLRESALHESFAEVRKGQIGDKTCTLLN